MEFINETDRLDQHFLIDSEVIDRFIKEADLKSDDIIVEVGPGKGSISTLVAAKVKKLYLIELDERLDSFLKPLAENSNVEIIYGNVLDTYIPECDKILTSLPYSIIEPFIKKVIKCNFKELLMITGSNYASSVLENKVNKLAILTNCFFKAEKIIDILPESFSPKPRVLSTMIRLSKIKENDLTDILIIFRNLYFYSDKKIKNSLVESFIRLEYLKGRKLTQKEAKLIIDKLNLEESLLAKNYSEISNDELEILYLKLKEHFKNT